MRTTSSSSRAPTDSAVDRCFATGACNANGAACTTSAQCCSGNCSGTVCATANPIANGQSCAFGDQCVADQGVCTANADCCNGYCDIQTERCGLP